MKKQLLSLLFFCSFTLLAVAQDSSLSKQKFRDKILQAIPSGSHFIFLDTGSGKLHTDKFYKLPSPLIKARMLEGNPVADTFYCYLYPKDQFGTVLSAVFTAAFNAALDEDADTAMYQFSMPVEDSSGGFLIYFYPSSIDTVRSGRLHSSLQKSFGTKTVVTLESLQLVREDHEPPPPPPPPPKRKRKRQ